MPINLTLYEDTGPAVSGAGTYRNAVGNIGLKADGTDDTGNHYAYSPVIRPYQGEYWSHSYKKYHFLKLHGTYPAASRVRIKISNGVKDAPPEGYESESTLVNDADPYKVRIFYKLTNTYEQPNDAWDGELRFLEDGTVTLYPSLSLTGPGSNQTYPQYLTANTTYYTQYLVTQLEVPVGSGVGNIGEVNIEWFVDEYEDGDL